MKNVIKISLLLLIVVISRFVLQVDYNEMDVLPSAYAVYNPSWLANDWYLSLSIPYRALFGYVIGFFIEVAGFIPVLLIGRLVTYALFAIAYLKLLATLKVNFYVGGLALIVYLTWFSEGAFYGEWIIGGLETKVFSYIFILFSLSAFLKKHIKVCLLYAGLALSFHILIGGYYLICLSSTFLWRGEGTGFSFKKIVRNSHFLIMGGLWGFYGIYSHLIDSSALSTYGWEIYTQIRVPYHVVPKFSFLNLAIPFTFSFFNFAVILFSKRKNLRILSSFSIAAYAISLVGYLTHFFGDPSLLRFYFFRFNDGIQGLFLLLIVGSIVSDQIEIGSKKQWKLSGMIFFFISLVSFGFANFENIKRQIDISNYSEKAILEKSTVDINMSEWIKKNTDQESVFIVSPKMSNFYLEADRSMFVSWKHSPQSGAEIEEWYRRIMLLNRGLNPMDAGVFDENDLIKNYEQMNESDILNIKSTYPEVEYIILSKDNSFTFPVIYETEKLKLYRLE